MLNMLNFNDILRRISQSQKHHNQQCSKEIQPWHPRAKAPSSLPRDTGPETVPTLEKTPELTSICRFKSNRDYTHLIFAEQKGPKKIKPPPVIHRLPTKEIQKNLWPPPPSLATSWDATNSCQEEKTLQTNQVEVYD